MIIRSIFLCGLCVLGVSPAPLTVNQVISKMPKEMLQFITGLSGSEKVIFKDWATKYSTYKNDKDALRALKARSPALGEKAAKMDKSVQVRVNSLHGEAKAIAKQMIAGIRKLLVETVAEQKPSLKELQSRAHQAHEKYQSLSASAKAELEKEFPFVTALINCKGFFHENPNFQTRRFRRWLRSTPSNEIFE